MEKLKIAIADDHKLAIEGYKAVLVLNEIEVIAEFTRGDELVKWIDKQAHKIDILLLDIQMPGMDGIEVLRYLKRHGIQVKTIIISAFSTANYVADVLSLGCKGFLLKATCHLEFEKAVEIVANGGTFYSKDIEMPELNEATQLEKLSGRERELLPMLEEYSYAEISKQTELSISSIKTYVSRMKEKLGIQTKVGLVKWFYNKK
ncbi:putative DNA-binding response regulator [Tenacibaculum sp. 190524A02b]|uniref:DNA-binding response regulator n=1 Tax=Tenacibaculum vairaonense TaxID=3137860 RepID=A0ABM9PJ49_9FLAO